jgi:MFS family permease
MRIVGLVILGLGSVAAAVLGWHQIWHVLREGRTLALAGWIIGLVGLGLMVGRRRQQSVRRLELGMVLAALGLALMAVPTDSRGLWAGLRVGYAGSVLAVLPHCWRLYRKRAARPLGPKPQPYDNNSSSTYT